MSDNDLIRRGDALALPYRLSPSLDASDGYYVSVDAIRTLPAAQVTVKPLDLSEPSFVIHASGSFSFFSSAQAAEDYADSLGRHSYEYNPDTVELYGKKLKIAHDEWIDEMQKQHEARIRSALTVTPHDPAKVRALVEAAKRVSFNYHHGNGLEELWAGFDALDAALAAMKEV